MDYGQAVCPVCGKSFTKKHKRAVYDTSVCRVKASRARSRLKHLNKSQKKLLKSIRDKSPATAAHIEKAVSEHGTECFDLVVKACLVAVSEFGKFIPSAAAD